MHGTTGSGTYIRTAAIDRLIEAFLGFDADRPRQIISLGAGSDTRFFRFRKRYAQIDLAYHEFDFPLNTKQKIRQMQTVDFYQAISKEWGVDWTPEGRVVYEDDAKEPPCFHLETGKSNYYLHSLDLRSLVARDQTPGAVEGNLSRWKISIAIPTVILSECCLIYLSPEEADATLSYFSKPFRENYAPIGVVIYEPIRPNDAFGKTMVSNLTARGIHLQTLHAHDTLKSQQERLWKQGLKSDANQQGEEGAEGEAAAKDRVSVVDGGAEAADIDFLWRTWIDDREKQRIEKLEWMDELEEFTLLARHYCAVWAWKESSGRPHQHFHNDAGSGELGRIFANWARLPTQEPKE